MTEFEKQVLSCIGSTEPSDFNEFCSALKRNDIMPDGKSEWAELFKVLRMLEDDVMVDIERIKGKIESLQLTQLGANSIRDYASSKRGLLNAR